MARYRKIDVRIWSDQEVRRLSRPQPNGLSLWFHLLTGRETGIIPGAFAARESGMAEELGWSLEGFREAFREVSGEAFRQGSPRGARKPLAMADWRAGFVWIPQAVKYNPPQSPNVIRSWADAWDELPECDLKIVAYEGLKAFVKGMGEGFVKAFDEAIKKPSWKPSSNQEQEQEQEIERENARAREQNVPRETSPEQGASAEETFGNTQPPQQTNADASTETNTRTLTSEAAMSIELRKRGVKVTSAHPTLVAWVRDGYTVDQLLGALAIARQSLGDDRDVPAAYLDRVLRDTRNWPDIDRPKPNGHGAPTRVRSSTGPSYASVIAALDSLPAAPDEDWS